MSNDPTARLSVALQSVAELLSADLMSATDQRVPFVLICQVGTDVQYVSNCARADGVALIESLLARWKAGRADIPAAWNPDRKRP